MNRKKKVVLSILAAVVAIGVIVAIIVIASGSDSTDNSTENGSPAEKTTTQVIETTTEETTETTTEETTTEESTTGEVTTEAVRIRDVGNMTYKEAYVKIIEEYDKKYSYGEATYSLIYFNDDNIPELVAGKTGSYVSMYTYSDGYVYTVIDEWSYGGGGNHGYDYIPKKNVVRNYNSDYAGVIMNEMYAMMNDEFFIDLYYGDCLNVRFFEDENGDGVPDADEKVGGEYVHYFLGDTEITEDKYSDYIIDGAYQNLVGLLPSYKMEYELLKTELLPVNDAACREAYIKTIEEYCKNNEDGDTNFSLIYFDGDDVPELVCQFGGCTISMYTYADGKVYPLLEDWSYGGGGNYGYEYASGQNVLRNLDSDNAGQISKTYYSKINEKHELERYYGGCLWIEYMDETCDEDKARYYLEGEEISKDEYNSYIIEGHFEMIKGDYDKEDMIGHLK